MIALERKVLTIRSITAIILLMTLSLISLDKCLEVTHLIAVTVRKLYFNFKQFPLLKRNDEVEFTFYCF